jgi:signal transduction histidine kinase/ActR/RegA family two-component response regulator
MNETLPLLTAEYAAALQEYLAEPQEAGLMHAYDLGRRTLGLAGDVAELGIAHGKVLAAALAGAGTAAERARLGQRAAEFLGEALAPCQMVLRGYREANAQLQRWNATLEQRVQERTAALGDASRRKDEFLAMLGHELRNPLAPIRHALQIMRLAGSDSVEVGQARDLMERQVQNLVRLIDDLLDVSRITRGKIHLRKERLDLATVVQSALEISRPHLEAAGHELTVALPPKPLYVQADAARLAQVVANLLNNATKYTEPGGRIWLTAEREGAQAVVRVRDTGIGIPAEMLPDIFGMFVQVDSALERSQGGLGIGLTLVKSLVEMHGGGVEACSAGPRQGSEFVVRLPLAPEGRASQEEERHLQEPQPPDRLPALRILVVDDNRESADSLGLLMKLVGHDVRVAYDGPAAVEVARTFQPQVLLQDLQLPGMSGFEVARRIREQPATGNVLFVALTGYGSDEDRRRCLEGGFDHHLVKPVDFCTLQQVLASLEALAPEKGDIHVFQEEKR